MLQKINLVIVVLDGSYLLEEHFDTIFEAYLEPILKHMKQQQIIIEKEDKEKREIEKNKITPKLKCGLIVFGNYEPFSRSPFTAYYFDENLLQFEKLITGIEFEDGGMRENAVAEGLVAALEMFDTYQSQIKPETSEATEIIKHCLLISNSHPCPDLVHRNLDEKYDQFSMKQIVEEMKNQKIHFSLITPERDFTELEELVTEVNQDVEVHNATDVINSSHVVKLAGFKPPFTHPKEVSTSAQKRKREDSTSSTGTNDQQILSAQNSGNEAKKVKLEQTQELVKDQPNVPNGQLPGQQSQPLQTLPLIKKEQTATTQNSSGQQSSNQLPVINTTTPAQTTSAQTTPKLQTPAVSTAATSNTNPMPPQVIQISQNVLAQAQQPIKITNNQATSNNVTTVQMRSPAPTGTMPRPQRPAFTSQQAMSGSLLARPQQQNMTGIKYPPLHSNFHSQLAAMAPEKRSQFLANIQAQAQAQQPLQLRNAINAQQISNQLLRQNNLLQHELQQNLANVLVRNQQLNLGLPLQNGTQINIGQQQIGNFVTSAPISEAVSNGFVTSGALNIAATAQQLGAFNASTTSTTNSASVVGYTTAPGTINAQFVGNTNATNSAQLPVSTMMNSISTADMNNVVTGPTVNVTTGVIGQIATPINGGGVRPIIPQKKINALWSGHIAWSANTNQGQKRELTCQVSAFPVPTKKTAPLSQMDYMIQYWPDKMEISGINYFKDAINNAGQNPKIVSFLPNPTNPTIQENNSTFGVLMRILDGKKMAAFVRFPNAPNPNGGIVLFTNSGNSGLANAPKLLGLLFLDTPLPISAPVLSQGQQIRPPQTNAQQQAHTLQLLQLQHQLLRTQQQQQQPAMQATATGLQQNTLQQQKLALQQQTQLQQQQQMAGLNMQHILQQRQQQRQVINPNILQNQQQLFRHQQMQQLLQAARNANPGITDQQLMALLLQRQQSQQQPTQ
uniref:Mediator of RNA polymerase II transcription subunit 25 n=1 Tax=Anthurium amnicola TaxID=1678845 RepID=A0A1D1XTW3_9ARAE